MGFTAGAKMRWHLRPAGPSGLPAVDPSLRARRLASGVGAAGQSVSRAGETFPHDPTISESEAQLAWVEQNQAVLVAVTGAGAVVGTYYVKPNSLSLGAHVANAGYVVAEHCRRQVKLSCWPACHLS